MVSNVVRAKVSVLLISMKTAPGQRGAGGGLFGCRSVQLDYFIVATGVCSAVLGGFRLCYTSVIESER